ncbi:MAG: amino acid racemase [Chloroflexi bacterium]|nr:amino acid racemase [Chloroflexota bacterium]
MSKRIGILGGISHESTLAYYELIVRKYFAHSENAYYPEIVIFSLDFQKFTDFEDSGDRAGYIAYILEGVQALIAAGADFILMAANSPHAVYEEVTAQVNIPFLSIVEVTLAAALRVGMQKLLLLGIKFTMQATFYQTAFANANLTLITPLETEQDEINRIIFAELAIGNFTEASKQWLLRLIDQYAIREQIDGVILGCTELPLLLQAGDSDLPLLNTLDLHAEAALNYALRRA